MYVWHDRVGLAYHDYMQATIIGKEIVHAQTPLMKIRLVLLLRMKLQLLHGETEIIGTPPILHEEGNDVEIRRR